MRQGRSQGLPSPPGGPTGRGGTINRRSGMLTHPPVPLAPAPAAPPLRAPFCFPLPPLPPLPLLLRFLRPHWPKPLALPLPPGLSAPVAAAPGGLTWTLATAAGCAGRFGDLDPLGLELARGAVIQSNSSKGLRRGSWSASAAGFGGLDLSTRNSSSTSAAIPILRLVMGVAERFGALCDERLGVFLPTRGEARPEGDRDGSTLPAARMAGGPPGAALARALGPGEERLLAERDGRRCAEALAAPLMGSKMGGVTVELALPAAPTPSP